MTATPTARALPRNPHFDDQRVIWDDSFSGQYEPVAYDQQFDDQWRLFLERKAASAITPASRPATSTSTTASPS